MESIKSHNFVELFLNFVNFAGVELRDRVWLLWIEMCMQNHCAPCDWAPSLECSERCWLMETLLINRWECVILVVGQPLLVSLVYVQIGIHTSGTSTLYQAKHFAQTHTKLVQYLCWYIRACIDHSNPNEFEFECILYLESDWYTTDCKWCFELLVLSTCYHHLVGNAPCIHTEQSLALMFVLVRTISDTSAGNQFVWKLLAKLLL